jgi:hypothetical protein
MFEIVMGLEQGISCEELNKDATNTPDITWKAPPEIEDNLWRSIMTSRHDRRVILIVECRRAKVDQSNLTVQQDTTVASIS